MFTSTSNSIFQDQSDWQIFGGWKRLPPLGSWNTKLPSQSRHRGIFQDLFMVTTHLSVRVYRRDQKEKKLKSTLSQLESYYIHIYMHIYTHIYIIHMVYITIYSSYMCIYIIYSSPRYPLELLQQVPGTHLPDECQWLDSVQLRYGRGWKNYGLW